MTRRLDWCSLSFLTKDSWNDGGVLTCKSQNNFQSEPTFLKLSYIAIHIFQFSSENILENMLKWRHQPLQTKIPSCKFLLCTWTLCCGRKERAEFSILYHTKIWLHSLNIIYIHGFLPSEVLENVVKATKGNYANGKCLGGCIVNCWRLAELHQ